MHYIIVGNGIAGTSAARAIREIDSGGRITMISGETAYPFSRTALMYVAMGQMRLEDTEFLERRFYSQNRIRLLQNRAERIDPANRRVVLSGGDELQYDRLLLATGSLPAELGSKGTELDGVVHFVSRGEGGTRAAIEVVEMVGAEKLLSIVWGESRVVARTAASFRDTAGEAITFRLKPGRALLYDAETGKRLPVDPL